MGIFAIIAATTNNETPLPTFYLVRYQPAGHGDHRGEEPVLGQADHLQGREMVASWDFNRREMMSENKFTPGPWSIGIQNGHGGISVNAKYEQVATVYLGLVSSCVPRGVEHFALPENHEAVANAQLIAAAPKTFNKLIEIRKWMDGDVCGPWDAKFVAEIDAIIAEVRGAS